MVPATVGIRNYLNKRARSRIMEKKIDIQPSKQLDDLKKTVQRKDKISKSGQGKEIANKKIGIKRRRH